MRTTEIKIDGEKKEALLVAGGSGFKIYSVSGLDGWALALGRKVVFISESEPLAEAVVNYVNIKYHSANARAEIQKNFSLLVESLVQKKDAPSVTE